MASTVTSKRPEADDETGGRSGSVESPSGHLLQPDDKAAAAPAGRILVRLPPQRIAWVFMRRSWQAKAAFIKDSLFLDPLLRRGDWDRRLIPFADHEAYQLLDALIRSDFDAAIGEPALCRYYTQRGQPDPVAKAERKLADYLDKYGAIARDMQAAGYRPFMTRDEIGIALGRDGEVIKVSGGNHRLALAQLLGLPEVVAEIRFAHLRRYTRDDRRVAGSVGAMVRRDASALGMLPVD